MTHSRIDFLSSTYKWNRGRKIYNEIFSNTDDFFFCFVFDDFLFVFPSSSSVTTFSPQTCCILLCMAAPRYRTSISFVFFSHYLLLSFLIMTVEPKSPLFSFLITFFCLFSWYKHFFCHFSSQEDIGWMWKRKHEIVTWKYWLAFAGIFLKFWIVVWLKSPRYWCVCTLYWQFSLSLNEVIAQVASPIHQLGWCFNRCLRTLFSYRQPWFFIVMLQCYHSISM